MGTELLSLFLGRISGPFSAVSGGPGDEIWLEGVGLRPWVALWIPFFSRYHRAQALSFPVSWGCAAAAQESQWGSLACLSPLHMLTLFFLLLSLGSGSVTKRGRSYSLKQSWG